MNEHRAARKRAEPPESTILKYLTFEYLFDWCLAMNSVHCLLHSSSSSDDMQLSYRLPLSALVSLLVGAKSPISNCVHAILAVTSIDLFRSADATVWRARAPVCVCLGGIRIE